MKRITIVGGGLSGLTLGIALRQREVPVTIFEAGQYPRHRVCGEFISGKGLESMERLGLSELFKEIPSHPADSVAFHQEVREFRVRHLPETARCVSRFHLDLSLAERFEKLGGELRVSSRWTQALDGEGVVRATGRRAHATRDGWRWLGLKAHARRVELRADLELHFSRDAYIGLCRLPEEEVNVCGMFRRRCTDQPLPKILPEIFRGLGGALPEKLACAEWDSDSVCTVAGLPVAGGALTNTVECRVGDAFGFIPPVTGNGMSIAFESAELAAERVYDYATGVRTWSECSRTVAEACRARFRTRLRWAGWLQWALFNPVLRRTLIPVVCGSQWGLRASFQKTR